MGSCNVLIIDAFNASVVCAMACAFAIAVRDDAAAAAKGVDGTDVKCADKVEGGGGLSNMA